jgi:hypothetical protein
MQQNSELCMLLMLLLKATRSQKYDSEKKYEGFEQLIGASFTPAHGSVAGGT